MGGFATGRLKKRFRGEIKPDRTVQLPSPHGFRDVKGRRKQEDDGQTADVSKKKVGWAGERKVRIKNEGKNRCKE